MKREFTATAYIFDKQKILLIYHRKLLKWLPPGGHIEENETPPEAALRETLEETGLVIELIKQENTWVNQLNASSFERPYLCLLEEIPAYKDIPTHQHMDMIYIARPLQQQTNITPSEKMRWFTLSELLELQLEVDIFTETLQVISHLFEVFAEQSLISK